MNGPKPTRIELVDVEKRYRSQPVLQGLSLLVEPGELVALVGPSGCGKSTTIGIIAGIHRPDGGDVLFDGRSVVSEQMYRRNVGVVFQSYALFPHMSVERNIGFGLRMRRVANDEAGKLIEQALRLSRLEALRDRMPHQLSGGQKQRVALARALVITPQVLLMDEPLSSLDASLREEMRFEIRAIQQRSGVSAIFVTHDQREAMAVGDRIAVMVEGRVRQVDSPEWIYRYPVDAEVARLVGSVNQISSVYEGIVDGQCVVVGRDGVRRAGRIAPSSRWSPAPGEYVDLLVRPEEICVAAAREHDDSAVGTLQRSTFLGRDVELVVDIGFMQLVARTQTAPGIATLRVGDPVTFRWDPATAIVSPSPGNGHDSPQGSQ